MPGQEPPDAFRPLDGLRSPQLLEVDCVREAGSFFVLIDTVSLAEQMNPIAHLLTASSLGDLYIVVGIQGTSGAG